MSSAGGARKGSGRKKGTGVSNDIKRHCDKFIKELLLNDAIKLKVTKQLSENLKDHKEDYLYIIESNGLYKIGYTSSWLKRLKHYRIHNVLCNVVYVTKMTDCFELEAECHDRLKHLNVTGEWYDLTNKRLIDIISFCSSYIK